MMFADGELDAERAAEVEAYLERSSEARAVVATFAEIGAQVRGYADDIARNAGADGIADNVMARIERGPDNVVPLRKPVEPAKPSVAALAFGGLAAAAAVALLVWRVAGVGVVPVDTPRVAETAAPPRPELVVASATAPAPDYDPEPTVSVDAIDFGARTGTIFYVPTDTGTTTTVVWLSDEETGGM
jgi:anti-sigma factor RsiW